MSAPAEVRAEVDPRADPVLRATHVSVDLDDGTRLIDDVDLVIRPGELVAIVGESGAGKTTLLEVLAGLRRTSAGSVWFDRPDGTVPAYVPQDDIVHHELTVESTIRHAARLRHPASTTTAYIDSVVDDTLRLLALSNRRSTIVRALSGGQRKRVSIATELVTSSPICLLDEPTSGLDHVTAESLVAVLCDLAGDGGAVVFTTHNLLDVQGADRVIIVAGGRITYDGSPSDAPLPIGRSQRTGVERPGRVRPTADRSVAGDCDPIQRASQWQQCRVLTRRSFELLTRNRTTLAIMGGSPVLVVTMLAILYPSSTFDTAPVDALNAVSLTYWTAFAGFFFGLTFGLLQICNEIAVLRRECPATISASAYVASKFAAMLPALLVVNAVMLTTLVGLGRLPSAGLARWSEMLALLMLDSFCGLALGLLASAAVGGPAQAALALPMLCFPAVLFSGSVVAIDSMTTVGRGIGTVISDRWAFEALGRTIGLDDVLDGSSGGRFLLAQHGDAFSGSVHGPVLLLSGIGVALAFAARRIVISRTAVR